MRKLAIGLGTVIALAGLSTEATAACRCLCVNGLMQPVCDNAMEIRPICPPTICGIVPPAVRPITPPMVPPIGTTHCAPEQVLNPYTGRYEWRTICR